MIKPLTCWNCNKVFADLKKGTATLQASTDLKEVTNETQIEIKCPRCKKMNSITI